MNTNDFLAKFHKVTSYGDYTIKAVAPRMVLRSGVSLSVQASRTHYCEPRSDFGPYTEVELGYPTAYLPYEFYEYAEEKHTLQTVWGDVPVELVDAYIRDQGGIVAAEIQHLETGCEFVEIFDNAGALEALNNRARRNNA